MVLIKKDPWIEMPNDAQNLNFSSVSPIKQLQGRFSFIYCLCNFVKTQLYKRELGVLQYTKTPCNKSTSNVKHIWL